MSHPKRICDQEPFRVKQLCFFCIYFGVKGSALSAEGGLVTHRRQHSERSTKYEAAQMSLVKCQLSMKYRKPCYLLGLVMMRASSCSPQLPEDPRTK